MNGPLDHARELLEKASDDLIAADAILGTGRALWAACFHAQQAAEKSIKALLAADDVTYPYTHDLRELLRLLGDRVPELLPMAAGFVSLTPFPATARYESRISASEEQARSSLDLARAAHGLAAAVIEERGLAEAVRADEAQPADPNEA